MVSTPTAILRLELQGSQDNTGVWNVNANQVFQSIEDAIAGFYDVSSTGGDTTLTPVNYAADNARKSYIRISNGQTITSMVRVVSATPRKFLVHNASAAGAFDVKFGGSTGNAIVIPRGCICEILVRSDLSTIYTSPFIDVATGQVNAASLTTLYGRFPVETENTGIGVLSSTLTTPPGSPTTGDRYIVPVGGLGAWTGQDAKIAEWDGAAWAYTNPSAGMIAWDRANHWLVGYDAGGWQRGAVTDPIPTGNTTFLPFFNSVAPTGWTASATAAHHNRAIRSVTSGGGVVGGTRDFSQVFGITATDGHALSTAETAPHTHGGSVDAGGDHSHAYQRPQSSSGVQGGSTKNMWDATDSGSTTGGGGTHTHSFTSTATGGGAAHAHNIDLRVAYLDMLLCSRN